MKVLYLYKHGHKSSLLKIVLCYLQTEIMKEFRNNGSDTSVLLGIRKWGWSRHDLLQVFKTIWCSRSDGNACFQLFSHSRYGGAKVGVGVLTNDSYWKMSVPHVAESGILLHIQPSISIPARLVVWNKVHFFNWEFWEAWYLGPCLIPVSFCRIGIHLPDTDNTTSKWLKEDKLTDLKIYIHEQEKIIFHRSNNLNYFIVVLFSLMLS